MSKLLTLSSKGSLKLGELNFSYYVQTKDISNPLVIFQPPGWGFPHQIYLSLFERIQDRFTVIHFIPRGNGGSDRPNKEDDMSIQNMADDLDLFRDYLGLDEIELLIGHSAGGSMALAYAQLYSQRVRRLLLIDPTCQGYDPQIREDQEEERKRVMKGIPEAIDDVSLHRYLRAAFRMEFYDPDQFYDKFMEAFDAIPSPVVSFWTMKAFNNSNSRLGQIWNQSENLDKITCEVFIIVGSNWKAPYEDYARMLIARIEEKCEEMSIPKCGHFGWIEKEEELWERIDYVLAKLRV
jgi:proline iminopeptidase